MGHMVIGYMVGTSQIEMTQLGMAHSWIHSIGKAMDMEFTLVLVQAGITIIIVIILTVRVT